MGLRVEWLRHASVRIRAEDGFTVYVDPWEVSGPPADLILVTHPHYDHCSAPDVQKLLGPRATVVATPAAAADLRRGGVRAGIVEARQGEAVEVGPARVLPVPAYNVNKFRSPGVPYHPRHPDFAGYVLTLAGERVYLAGDTDVIPPEVAPPIDLAVVPVSGTYVMTAEEAAAEVNRLQPARAMPVHIGTIVGSLADADRFAALCRVPVVRPAK